MNKRLEALNEMTENDQVNGLYPVKGQTVYSFDGELFDHDQPDSEEGEVYYSAKVKNVDMDKIISKTLIYKLMEEVEEQLFCLMPEEVDLDECVKADVNDLRKLVVDYYNQKGMVTCFQVEGVQEHIMNDVKEGFQKYWIVIYNSRGVGGTMYHSEERARECNPYADQFIEIEAEVVDD